MSDFLLVLLAEVLEIKSTLHKIPFTALGTHFCCITVKNKTKTKKQSSGSPCRERSLQVCRHTPAGLCRSTSCLAFAETGIHAVGQICPEKNGPNCNFFLFFFFCQTHYWHTSDDRPMTTNYVPAAAVIEASTMTHVHLKFMQQPSADGKDWPKGWLTSGLLTLHLEDKASFVMFSLLFFFPSCQEMNFFAKKDALVLSGARWMHASRTCSMAEETWWDGRRWCNTGEERAARRSCRAFAHVSLVFITLPTMWSQPSAPAFLCLMGILLLSNVANGRLYLFSLTLDRRVSRESNHNWSVASPG